MRIPSIEAAVRSAFSWALVKLFGGAERVPLPDWSARPFRILFIRDDGIGDLMVTMELLRAIKESSPTFTLDLLCSPQNAAFGRTLPFVNEVIVHKREFLLKAIPTWRRLRRNHYDVVIDGRVAIANVNKQTLCLLLASGATWRVGLAGRRNDRVYSVPIHLPHFAHWIDAIIALGQPFDIRPDSRDWRAKLVLPDADRARAESVWDRVGKGMTPGVPNAAAAAGHPRILVNLYSASADRQWPLERFAPVLARIRVLLPKAAIIIPTMPSGDAMAERLAAPAGASAVPLSLSEVTAVTATADLVISPDTAITVIASAFQVPILALMRKNTERWIPYRVRGGVAYSDDPRSLVGLPIERVLARLGDIVREMGWH